MDFPIEGSGNQSSAMPPIAPVPDIGGSPAISGTEPANSSVNSLLSDLEKTVAAAKEAAQTTESPAGVPATNPIISQDQFVSRFGDPVGPVQQPAAETPTTSPMLDPFAQMSPDVNPAPVTEATASKPDEVKPEVSDIVDDLLAEKPQAEDNLNQTAETVSAPDKTPTEIFQEEVAEVFKLGVEEQKKGLDQAAAKLLETIKQSQNKTTFS